MIRAGLLLAALTAGPAFALTVDDVIAKTAALCKEIGGGTLTVPPETVVQVDLTGDGVAEDLVDLGQVECSSKPNIASGKKGKWLSVIVAGQEVSLFGRSWQVQALDGVPLLLLTLDGSACGGESSAPCVEALVWDAARSRFATVRPESAGP